MQQTISKTRPPPLHQSGYIYTHTHSDTGRSLHFARWRLRDRPIAMDMCINTLPPPCFTDKTTKTSSTLALKHANIHECKHANIHECNNASMRLAPTKPQPPPGSPGTNLKPTAKTHHKPTHRFYDCTRPSTATPNKTHRCRSYKLGGIPLTRTH